MFHGPQNWRVKIGQRNNLPFKPICDLIFLENHRQDKNGVCGLKIVYHFCCSRRPRNACSTRDSTICSKIGKFLSWVYFAHQNASLLLFPSPIMASVLSHDQPSRSFCFVVFPSDSNQPALKLIDDTAEHFRKSTLTLSTFTKCLAEIRFVSSFT